MWWWSKPTSTSTKEISSRCTSTFTSPATRSSPPIKPARTRTWRSRTPSTLRPGSSRTPCGAGGNDDMKPAKGRVIAFPRDDAPDHQRAVRHKEDPYVSTRKPLEPTVCPKCKAVFMAGRGTWQRPPPQRAQRNCPAWHRLQDGLPPRHPPRHGESLQEH